MKLNLVPTYVSKERQGRTAIVGSLIIAVVGIAAAVFLTTTSKAALDQAKKANEDSKAPAQRAADTSTSADTLIASAAQVIKDSNLAAAMNRHNDVYPNFYTNDILPYIPPFYRINSLSAHSLGADSCEVTMVGTLKSFQQYADLVLALMRIKGAVNVSRQGFTYDGYVVPALSVADQTGRPHRLGEGPVPDDPIERLAYYQAQGTPPPGYQGVGGFGSGTDDARGAAPDESLVTCVVTITGIDLQTPNPRSTIGAGGGSSSGGGGGFGGFGGGGAGGRFGGGPTAVGTPPGVSSPGGGGAAARSKGDD